MTPASAKPYTVLVVDDDPSVLATYRRLLERAGYKTIAVDDPNHVIDNGHCDRPVDLVLLDYKMPGMDGLTLLAKLRRREFRAPCILLSAFLNEDLRCQAENLGVKRILEKPVGVRILRRALDELLPLSTGQAKATG